MIWESMSVWTPQNKMSHRKKKYFTMGGALLFTVVPLRFSLQSPILGFNPKGQMFYLEGREIKREKMWEGRKDVREKGETWDGVLQGDVSFWRSLSAAYKRKGFLCCSGCFRKTTESLFFFLISSFSPKDSFLLLLFFIVSFIEAYSVETLMLNKIR